MSGWNAQNGRCNLAVGFVVAIRETPEDFKKALKNKLVAFFFMFVLPSYALIKCLKYVVFYACRVEIESKEDKKPEIDDKFWELLLSADKKDYESICAQYGVTDFRGMLKKLNEKKVEREQEQERVCFCFTKI